VTGCCKQTGEYLHYKNITLNSWQIPDQFEKLVLASKSVPWSYFSVILTFMFSAQTKSDVEK
jgi:hypothetical protein